LLQRQNATKGLYKNTKYYEVYIYKINFKQLRYTLTKGEVEMWLKTRRQAQVISWNPLILRCVIFAKEKEQMIYQEINRKLSGEESLEDTSTLNDEPITAIKNGYYL
jgi:hypothetical protein